MIERSFTAGAQRALELAQQLAAQWGDESVEPGHLLWALMSDEASAFEILEKHGVTKDIVTRESVLGRTTAAVNPNWSDTASTEDIVDRLSSDVGSIFAGLGATSVSEPKSLGLEAWLQHAHRSAKRSEASDVIGTEHLLAALLALESPVREVLEPYQLDLSGFCVPQETVWAEPVAAPFKIDWTDPQEAERVTTLRILDAAANRAREGLRVVEDFVRFSLDDAHLARELKELRHHLSQSLRALDVLQLAASRDTQGDVGTTIHTTAEMSRSSPFDVVTANLKRVEEATRTLEEFAKVVVSFDRSNDELRQLPDRLGQVRYRLYTVEKALLLTIDSQRRLAEAKLYLLLTKSLCRLPVETVLREAIAGGVRVIQVREKDMTDRELVQHARRLRALTAETGTLFIMNDRPDLAVLVDADGVHVGQDELSVADVRRIVGPKRLIGVSTHSIEQARGAVWDGANYIGVGPTFVSGTKNFSEFSGLNYVSDVAAEIQLPAFAIGGIDTSNAQQVVAAGARGIAVSGAICRSEDPRGAAEKLGEFLAKSART